MTEIPSHDVLHSLYRFWIRESAQLKTVFLELYDVILFCSPKPVVSRSEFALRRFTAELRLLGSPISHAIHDTIKLLTGDAGSTTPSSFPMAMLGLGRRCHWYSPDTQCHLLCFFFTNTRLLRRFRRYPGRLLFGGEWLLSPETGREARIEFFGVSHFIVEHTLFGGDSWCLSSPTRVQVFVRTLAHVHGGEPTVILSVSAMKKVNAWTCAAPTTDQYPASVIPYNKRKSVIFVFWWMNSCCNTYCFYHLRHGLELICEFRL